VHPIRIKSTVILASLALAWTTLPGFGQTHTSRTGEVGTVVFENDAIVVVRVHMAPHERTPMHDIASPRLIIWLTPAHLRDTTPDGTVTDFARPAGSVEWLTPRRHQGENLADRDLEFLAVVPKAAAPPVAHRGPPGAPH